MARDRACFLVLLSAGKGLLREGAQRAFLVARGEQSEQCDGVIVGSQLSINVGDIEPLAREVLQLVQSRLLRSEIAAVGVIPSASAAAPIVSAAAVWSVIIISANARTSSSCANPSAS